MLAPRTPASSRARSDAGQGRRTAVEPDGERARLALARLSPNAREHRPRPALVPSVPTVTTSVWAPTAVLQRLRLALPHDAAVVDDGDAAGQLVGLLEVLRGEEHGGALVVEAPHLVPQREAAMGSRPVVGSSRNSTVGSWTSDSARSRRRRMPPE